MERETMNTTQDDRIFIGMDEESEIAMRAEYFKCGGRMPITPERVREVFKERSWAQIISDKEDRVRKDEKEACAKIADAAPMGAPIAREIRARGATPKPQGPFVDCECWTHDGRDWHARKGTGMEEIIFIASKHYTHCPFCGHPLR